jgi:hypothetical protein
MQSPDRSAIATAAIGAGLVSFVAYGHPALIAPLTLGLGACLAFCAFLKL